ncbi:MAG: hypothetical protein LBC97_04210, partial [Bifidobacteriaceae bacterium]|nr:hypothetical protein [Bifidobacteriaceae bacterium]
LKPVFDEMTASHRPQNALTWLTRPPNIGPPLLRAMARGEVEISHATFEALPSDKSRNWLRDLLVAVGVLEPYNAGIARMEAWLPGRLAPLAPTEAKTVSRYARWRIIRDLRRQADRREITNAMVNNARHRVTAAVELAEWAARRGSSTAELDQALLEQYLSAYPRRRGAAHTFVAWLHGTGVNRSLRMAPRSPATPEVTLSDAERWEAVDLLLHDDTIRLYARVGGLFTLLFAQPLTRIVHMRASQARVEQEKTTVAFDATPIEMPEPLDRLIAEHMARRGHSTYVAQDNGWLFPGGIPGKPMATENIRAELANRGIRSFDCRKGALFALAARIPAPVLADLIGIHPNTAVKWAALSARDWAGYIRDRTESQR